MERLQKVISSSGICSRRKAEELISNGLVKVNGEIVSQLGLKVSSSDIIEVNNKIIKKEEKEYYLLNKPREVLCTTTDDKNRKTVVDFINSKKRIFPVGRLDYDTTGLVLLTNDGEFANIINHPNNKILKVYFAKLNKIISKEDLISIKRGVKLDNKLIIPDKIKIKKINSSNNTCIIEIVIHEGINRVIRRIFEKFNYDVVKLKREKVGIFDLNGISSGHYRKLSPKEVKIIYSLKKD